MSVEIKCSQSLNREQELQLAAINNEEADETSIGEIRQKLASCWDVNINRVRLSDSTKKSLEDSSKLKILGDNKVILNAKLLGPQVGWRFVYVTEYFGPLALHIATYCIPFIQKIMYGRVVNVHSNMQLLFLFMNVCHFLKRELESIFIHKFSSETMPINNLPKNCAYYWGVAGILLSRSLYGPNSFMNPNMMTKFFFSIWTIAELLNFNSHIILSSLRPKGSKQRQIPFGIGFGVVSCPNYLFESIAWLAFAMMSQSKTAYVFWLVGTIQMFIWARKKHQRYRREFDNYPKERKAMFPYLF